MSKKMTGEVLIDFKDSGRDFYKGEVRTVAWEEGEYFCRAGWFKDSSGGVTTGTPNINDVVLKVDNLKTTVTAESING